MGRTYVDDVRITSDTMIQMIEVDNNGRLTFAKPKLQLLHSNCVVLGVVKREVADLKKS